ncbi:MAG: transposase [Oleispira sp.]|jgi:transposase
MIIGFETRQIVDIKISRIVTQYQTYIFENEAGDRFITEFLEGATRPIQYDASVNVTYHLRELIRAFE